MLTSWAASYTKIPVLESLFNWSIAKFFRALILKNICKPENEFIKIIHKENFLNTKYS